MMNFNLYQNFLFNLKLSVLGGTNPDSNQEVHENDFTK